jgi:hypothetical protein
MLKAALVFMVPLVLVAAIIRSQPTYEQVRTLCTEAMGLRGYDIGRARAVGEVIDGYWFVRGNGIGRRWSCTAQEQWWGVRLEDLTIYPVGE